ncbi:hypothetical protein SAMN04488101_106132 [Pedobacter nyackensis]|uniref:Uncharacterized protein n=1 Tax=Pedobacter nyackensis TaxID=475255 RepID=A0A1W2DBH1_9SPHI|nr:hypothetical protein SAMN04488101_106132 [Pedobacter nyackensis]
MLKIALICGDSSHILDIQIGLFEIYYFLYSTCRDHEHFSAWLINLKGREFYDKALIQFNE